LWRSWDYKVKAAEQLKLTSEDMLGFNLVDDVIKEPLGGAQTKPEEMAAILKQYLIDAVRELTALDAEKRIDARIEKFAQMGFYEER
jgi:acetyl-CoA carboxylase carboxyl transferase subunit alpha